MVVDKRKAGPAKTAPAPVTSLGQAAQKGHGTAVDQVTVKIGTAVIRLGQRQAFGKMGRFVLDDLSVPGIDKSGDVIPGF